MEMEQKSDYRAVRMALDEACEDLNSASGILGQLGALFATIAKGGPRVDELAKLGHYMADDFSNVMDCRRESLNEVYASTPEEKPHSPVWRGCACHDCKDGREQAEAA